MSNTTAMNWGDTNGEAQSNKVTYMKFNEGRNQIRISGNILRRYTYWLDNKDGQKMPFENLDFNRDTEAFESHGLNPVKELKLQSKTFTGELEFDKDGKAKPLGSKKAYLVPVVNRATGGVEYMELKKGIFDGINEVMQKLNDPRARKRFIDPEYRVPNPSFIDIVFNKTGKGLSTEYKVDVLDTMDFVNDEDMFEIMKGAHEQDKALLEKLRPTEEVFPRPTYDEQKAAIAKFLLGKPKEGENPDAPAAGGSSGDFKTYEGEGLSELDD